MTNKLSEIDPQNSIIFLGSGFSAGAKNILDIQMPAGSGLKDLFAAEIGVDSRDYDLMTLADEFSGGDNSKLYKNVYEIFTTTHAEQYQKDILREKWRRIYTTNYDDLVEWAALERGEKISSYSFDENKPLRLDFGTVIHLHGSIRNATEENALKQLVLNESSYIRQHIEKSPWYDDFVRDLKFCKNCFFIGYSLADMHIAALLMKNNDLKEKIFFITRGISPPLFEKKVGAYGTILPIGAEGFAELCKKLPRPVKNIDPNKLKAFKYLDPLKDKRTLFPPTSMEVINLVTFGSFNAQRCLTTLPESSYVVYREELVVQAVSLLNSHACLLVHSRLGNGKSIFNYTLAHRLSSNGYSCFLFKDNAELSNDDLDALSGYGRVIVFFDSYNAAIDVIPRCTELANLKFVVAVRTGVQEVRMHEIQSKLPKSLARININKLHENDKGKLKTLLNKSGVRVEELERSIDSCQEIREVVVSLYKNKNIKEKINSELLPLMSNQGSRMILVCAHLVKWIGADLEISFLRNVGGSDPYNLRIDGNSIAVDLLQFEDDNVQARSALFSEYLIQNHLKTEWIVDAVYELIVEAVQRKRDRNYQKILGGLMRFSALSWALENDPNRNGALIALYDRLHRDINVNEEPLFWLQYAILMIDIGDLGAAEGFLVTAYDRAKKNPSFKTYQIDTQALRHILLKETKDDSLTVHGYSQIIDKLKIVTPMLDDISHRVHAVHVMQEIEPFVNARVASLSLEQKNGFVEELDRIILSLERFDVVTQAETGSLPVLSSVARAKHVIWRSSTVGN